MNSLVFTSNLASYTLYYKDPVDLYTVYIVYISYISSISWLA